MTDKQRAAFEAWASGYDVQMFIDRSRHDKSLYAHAETNDAWAAWQAGIEHAETRMNRAGSSDSGIELPALPEAEIDDAGTFMSDAQVMTIESAKEYARLSVEHDRQQRGEVVVTWDETQTRIVAVTRQDEVGKILSVIAQANCQRSAEPVGVIREPDQPGEEPWPEVWADLSAGTELYAAPQPTEPVNMHSDAETTARVGAWLSAALCDPAVCQEMKDDIWAWMKSGQPNVQPAATAQEPGVPECPCPCGWENLHKLAVHDGAYLARTLEVGQILTDNQRDTAIVASIRLIEVCRAMLAAAPKFGEEE